MASDLKVEVLRSVTLFSACTEAELRLIAANTSPHTAKAGDVLTRQGSSGREFLVIVSGKARVDVDGRQVAMLGPGDFFGEVALLDDGPRTASVIATTDLRAEVCSHHEFSGLLVGAPMLALNVLRGVARRLRAADVLLTG